MGGRGGQGMGGQMSRIENDIRGQKFESAAVFQNGKLIFSKDGGRNEVSFTTEETAKFAGGTLTHNHPGKYDVSLSDKDIGFGSKYGLNEIRAVTKESTYSLKFNGQKHYESHVKAEMQRAKFGARSVSEKMFKEGKITHDQYPSAFQHEFTKQVSERLGYTYTRTKN